MNKKISPERIAAITREFGKRRPAKAADKPAPATEPPQPAPRQLHSSGHDYPALVTADLDAAREYLEAPGLTTTGLTNVTINLILRLHAVIEELASVKKELLWTQR